MALYGYLGSTSPHLQGLQTPNVKSLEAGQHFGARRIKVATEGKYNTVVISQNAFSN